MGPPKLRCTPFLFVQNIPIVSEKPHHFIVVSSSRAGFFFERGSWLREGRESFSEACRRRRHLLFSSTSSLKTLELFVIIFCSEKPVLSCPIEGETEVPGGDSLPVGEQVRRRALNGLPETCLLALKQERDLSCGRAMTPAWMENGKN